MALSLPEQPSRCKRKAPSIAANTLGNGVNIAAEGPSGSVDFYWAINGTATWHPEVVAGAGTTGWVESPMPDGDTTASTMVAYAGRVYVAAGELFGGLGVSTSVGDSGWWTSSQAIWLGIFSPGLRDGGVPSITINNGSVNVAVEDSYGNLSFFWQDSSGAFHQETVDTAANL